MKNLRDCYEEIIEGKKWCYYTSDYPNLSIETLKNEDESYEFIKEYFKCGGKEQVFCFEIIQEHEEKVKRRAPHIISTFLLGFIVADSFGINADSFGINADSFGINADSFGINADEDERKFKYLWFLTCLYHDIGYVYEEESTYEHLCALQTGGLYAAKKICGIEYISNDEFSTYCKEYVNIYLSHRARCTYGKKGKIDHGIVGGLMLYDRLRKNYESAKQKADLAGTESGFYYNGLFFSEGHFKYYAEAADAIIAHNIWKSTLDNYLEIEQYMKLNATNIPNITIDKKMAFVLAIADTLEPLKRTNNMDVLDEIEFESTKIKNGFNIFIPQKYETIFEGVRGLSSWVNVDVGDELSIRDINSVTERNCNKEIVGEYMSILQKACDWDENNN